MKKFRIIFTTILIFAFIVNALLLNYVSNYTVNVGLTLPQVYSAGETVEFKPIFVVTQEVQGLYDVKKAEILKQEFDEKVAKAEALLAKYNSPMQGLGSLIVQQADQCNGDYKIILAIAGNESRFGAVPVLQYNPFGYLDGVHYTSFADAINHIVCPISQRFIVPCNKDINCIVRTYAGPGDDKQRWVFNINWFINQI